MYSIEYISLLVSQRTQHWWLSTSALHNVCKWTRLSVVKLIYSEKAAKIDEISKSYLKLLSGCKLLPIFLCSVSSAALLKLIFFRLLTRCLKHFNSYEDLKTYLVKSKRLSKCDFLKYFGPIVLTACGQNMWDMP